MSTKGIRITIDGGVWTGKTILMEAFAAFLQQHGIAAENIVQLNDTVPECRKHGEEAINRMAQLAVEGLWVDTKFVFIERVVPKHTLSENDGDWNAMPDLSEHPLPNTPAFSLPRSQVAFEMTNKPSKEAGIANSVLSMLKFAGVMAAMKNALPKNVAVPSDLEDWLKRAGIKMDFPRRTHTIELPENLTGAAQDLVEFVVVMIKAGHADLLSKFELADFRKVEDSERDRLNGLRKDFINRGTDREFHEVRYIAKIVPRVGLFERDPEFTQLVEAAYTVRPDVLMRGATHVPLSTKHAPNAALMSQGAPVSDVPGDGKSLGDFIATQVNDRREAKRAMLDKAVTYVPPASRLQTPTDFENSSPAAQLLKAGYPSVALRDALVPYGVADLWRDHNVSIHRINRSKEGDWFDEVRARIEPDNVYQCMLEVCMARKDGETVREADQDAMRKALREYDPLIFFSYKVKNASLSGSHSGAVLGHPHKYPRGMNTCIAYVDDAVFQPALDDLAKKAPPISEGLSNNLTKIQDIGTNGANFLPSSGE